MKIAVNKIIRKSSTESIWLLAIEYNTNNVVLLEGRLLTVHDNQSNFTIRLLTVKWWFSFWKI